MLLDWLYYTLMESSAKQATLGKMACGLVVVDVHGRRISFGRATGRYFAKIISGLVCCIGYIVIGSDERKRGWHDSIAKTLVAMDGVSKRMGWWRMITCSPCGR